MLISFRNSQSMKTIYLAFNLLEKSGKFKMKIACLLGAFVSLLDLLGVALFGILGAITVNGINSKQPGNRSEKILALLGMNGFSLQAIAMYLGGLATFVLIARTVISMQLVKRTLLFLNLHAANYSASMIKNYLANPRFNDGKFKSQELLFSLTSGLKNLIVNTLNSFFAILSDFFIIVVLIAGIIIVSPITGFLTFIMFSCIGLLLYLHIHRKMVNLTREEVDATIKNNETFLQLLNMSKEIYVLNKAQYFSSIVHNERKKIAEVSAQKFFLPNISKYAIESVVLIGILVISGVQFFIQDASRAVATLSIFVVAGSRIGPAVLRIQQNAILLRTSIEESRTTYLHINSFGKYLSEQKFVLDFQGINRQKETFTPKVEIFNLKVIYKDTQKVALENINLTIYPGQFVAFVGPSGSGKSTLIDTVLGILECVEGEIRISNISNKIAITKFSGHIGYVPQKVFVYNGSVKKNIAFGVDEKDIDYLKLKKALELSCLDSEVAILREGIDTQLGEDGDNLSGGQRQRIGLARAFYSEPELLIFDESTSSLDSVIEDQIMSMLNKLRGKSTIIMAAHRLSAIKNADLIVYMKGGNIVGSGNFNELKLLVPEFAKQAQLMGL